jgi:serine protease inhibitor
MGSGVPDTLGLHLLDDLSTDSDGVLFSPWSVRSCLALALNGAAGRTKTELARVLGMADLPESRINRSFLELRTRLERLAPRIEVETADAVWSLPGTTFDPGFLERARTFYAAEARALTETGAAGAAAVNDWVSRRTRGRITQVLQSDDLAALTGYVLTDAVYFKGPWAAPFERRNTTPGSFQLPDGRRTDVPMMHGSARWPYLEDDEFQAITLDYAGGTAHMHVVLPRTGTAPALSRWWTALPRARPTPVELTLPRFTMTCDLDLVHPLTALGAGAPFEPGADFGRMGRPATYISALSHSTRIDVSEEGTEAAASSAVVLGRSLLPATPMVVDRPFFIAVVDRSSGLSLFLGRVTDPQPIPGPA